MSPVGLGVSVGLPAGQPRGIPISNPPLRTGGFALIKYNFGSKVQSIILSKFEKIWVLYVRKEFD